MATGSTLDDLAYAGIVGIIDPERPQVAQAVSQLKTGGVMVKMITGDAEKTAKAIASRLKIYNSTDLSISGEDLDHMNAAELDHAVSKATIFYRVSPKHKLTIVKVNFPKKKNFLFKNKFFFQDFTITRTYCRYDRRWC
jgi:Ca2+-transporting ATPase